jgi:hypothetical protein
VGRAVSSVVVLALAAAAGCGGDSVDRTPETPEDWAQSVCVVFTDWRDSVRSVGEELGKGESLSRDSLSDAAKEIDEANERLARQLRRIDAPESGSVADAQQAVRELSEEVDERRGEVEDTVDEAERSSDPAAVFDVISVVAAALRDTARDVRETLEDLERAGSGAVQALRQAPACRDLAGNPTGS